MRAEHAGDAAAKLEAGTDAVDTRSGARGVRRPAAGSVADATRAGPSGRVLVRARLGNLTYHDEPAVSGALNGDDTTTEPDGQADANATEAEMDLKE